MTKPYKNGGNTRPIQEYLIRTVHKPFDISSTLSIKSQYTAEVFDSFFNPVFCNLKLKWEQFHHHSSYRYIDIITTAHSTYSFRSIHWNLQYILECLAFAVWLPKNTNKGRIASIGHKNNSQRPLLIGPGIAWMQRVTWVLIPLSSNTLRFSNWTHRFDSI